MTRFNPKQFAGKKRIERAIKGNTGIYKIWTWNQTRTEYTPPPRGNPYVAFRRRTSGLISKTERETFPSLDEARIWRSGFIETQNAMTAPRTTPSFKDVVTMYTRDRLPQLRPSTQESYQKMLKIYFEPLKNLMISEVTPTLVDQWIEFLKQLPRTKRRKSFRHELDLLSGILKFYSEYDDDFKLPMKPRHRRNIYLGSFSGVQNKGLTDKEFFQFRQALLKFKDGELFAALATLQFFQALRISEAAGLYWSDIDWDLESPSRSKIRISRSVFFSRTKGQKPSLLNSFKNSKANKGMKTLPLMKESHQTLIKLQDAVLKEGLIFKQKNGDLLTYRQIQNAFDSAFKKAGLPYSGTHIMRHGGASYIYNKANGDLSLVQAITGNKDYKSALVYAHRNPLALNEFAEKDWQEHAREKVEALPQISANDQIGVSNVDKV